MFKRALGDQYQYIEASDGMSGLELYFLEKPDLVILDLTMPGANGMDILTQLRKLDPESQVIIGSSDVQEFSRREAEMLGAADFITKPFTVQSVQAIVQKVLEEGKFSQGARS
jgi:two-component system chemotaxis response regulator CheY